MVIETDENGYASTRQKSGEQETGKEETEKERDGLVYDTYTIRELNPPEGLKPVEDFEVTINREGETLYYILENKQIFSPVKLVKTDSTTGKTVPAAGAQFELLDEHKNPVTMTVHYPSGTDYDVFSTDDSGSFILPEKLPAGTYYFREIAAPEGYMINEELLEFQILEGHNWDEPLTVEFPDEPEMERICIKKTDAATGSGIEGVHFDILAKEDIVTPDGTVRLEAGEKAGTLITDADGAAWSEELFPGEYEITETRQAAGYMLPETPYNTLLEYREGEGMEVAIENHKSRITDTIAVWEGSGGKYAEAGEESVIADTVELDYLNKGEEYILKGVVTDAATGKPLVIDGKSVESEFRFTPQQPQTAVKMRFSADFSRLAGKRLVVYEYLYLREDLLSSHEDIKDEDQTVEILNQEEPAVKTGDNMPAIEGPVSLAASSAAVGIAVAWIKTALKRKKNERR